MFANGQSSIENPMLWEAARITVVYSWTYSLTFINVLFYKVYYKKQADAKGEPFLRYESVEMRPADRLQANFLEWYPVFMGPLWALAATGQLDDVSAAMAWSYVALRMLYFGLALIYGMNENGFPKALMISTFPGYAMLIYLLGKSVTIFVMY